MFEMSDPSHVGRSFTVRGRVRLGDASPGGRLRCDAVARYLQDVSDDDTRDAGVGGMTWVVRRTVLDVHSFPHYLETFELVTWCAGIGPRWAERRTSLVGDAGGRIEAATLWVALDSRTRRPARPSAEFLDIFGPSAQGRIVSSKLLLDRPSAEAEQSPWSLRFVDFDVMGHVNNAVYWEVVESMLGDHPDVRAPLRLAVEHVSPLERGAAPVCRIERVAGYVRGEIGINVGCAVDGVDAPSAEAARLATFATFATLPIR